MTPEGILWTLLLVSDVSLAYSPVFFIQLMFLVMFCALSSFHPAISVVFESTSLGSVTCTHNRSFDNNDSSDPYKIDHMPPDYKLPLNEINLCKKVV